MWAQSTSHSTHVHRTITCAVSFARLPKASSSLKYKYPSTIVFFSILIHWTNSRELWAGAAEVKNRVKIKTSYRVFYMEVELVLEGTNIGSRRKITEGDPNNNHDGKWAMERKKYKDDGTPRRFKNYRNKDKWVGVCGNLVKRSVLVPK